MFATCEKLKGMGKPLELRHKECCLGIYGDGRSDAQDAEGHGGLP